VTRPSPHYLRIVDDIRRRIAAGELRPGDQVPSARRITREWGVAIATASKVHATLRQEGLTQVAPGIGTVVTTPAAPSPASPPASFSARTARPASAIRRRASTRESEEQLGRGRIVRAGIDIADADGMAELSMRRIATELGVATMSLYRHVAGKNELLLHMIDAALGEEPLPATAPEGWRAQLEEIARMEWTVFRRHPWLAPAMSLTRPQLAPNALAITDRLLNALEGTGLGMEDRFYVHITLFSFVRGVATAFEPEAEAQRETGMTNEEWMDSQEARLQELVSSGSPLLRMALQNDFDFDLDKLFEFGLARLLDGLQSHLRTEPSEPSRSPHYGRI
jgi:DNA-binding transcriptional regulator YhcF (GntR family)/AcrR family transcriptional regulator